jgi:pimeloyl-ACP methyl ester carboxylesterase
VLAVLADGDRRDLLAAVELPTLVIHGTEDPLIPTQGGEETANSVSNAELVWIDGMGHDWPEEAWPQILNPICKLISQVEMKR